MTREEFLLWLYVVGIITFLIIFPLWIINVRLYYRELKRGMAFRPSLVLIRQLSIVNLLLSIFSILPIEFIRLEKLKGRKVWIDWDIRWGPFGSTLARIEEILRQQKGFALLIKLENPLKISFDSEHLEIREVIFEPYNYSTNLIRYCFGTVRGRLFAYQNAEEIKKLMKNEYIATGGIVVYGELKKGTARHPIGADDEASSQSQSRR